MLNAYKPILTSSYLDILNSSDATPQIDHSMVSCAILSPILEFNRLHISMTCLTFLFSNIRRESDQIMVNSILNIKDNSSTWLRLRVIKDQAWLLEIRYV